MELLVFALIFAVINVALIKYCNSIQKNSDCVKNFTWKGRKLIYEGELEKIRKRVNHKKSKF